MTFFHFVNCVALSYMPYFLTYKFGGLADYGAFWKCAQAGAIYLFTQLCKMLVLATFFPERDVTAGVAGGLVGGGSAAGGVDMLGEVLRCTMDLSDFVGIHFIMTKVAGKGELKLMVAGVGWGFAELLMTRVVVLWVGARGVEFSWEYVQLSFLSNVALVRHLASAALVWLWSRHDLARSLVPVVSALLLVNCYLPVLVEVMTAASMTSVTVLGVQSLVTGAAALATLYIYISTLVVGGGAPGQATNNGY